MSDNDEYAESWLRDSGEYVDNWVTSNKPKFGLDRDAERDRRPINVPPRKTASSEAAAMILAMTSEERLEAASIEFIPAGQTCPLAEQVSRRSHLSFSPSAPMSTEAMAELKIDVPAMYRFFYDLADRSIKEEKIKGPKLKGKRPVAKLDMPSGPERPKYTSPFDTRQRANWRWYNNCMLLSKKPNIPWYSLNDTRTVTAHCGSIADELMEKFIESVNAGPIEVARFFNKLEQDNAKYWGSRQLESKKINGEIQIKIKNKNKKRIAKTLVVIKYQSRGFFKLGKLALGKTPSKKLITALDYAMEGAMGGAGKLDKHGGTQGGGLRVAAKKITIKLGKDTAKNGLKRIAANKHNDKLNVLFTLDALASVFKLQEDMVDELLAVDAAK